MHALTYKDLVDEKIREWQQAVKHAGAGVEQLKPALDSAIAQLSALVEQETVGNTLETKDNILKIFTSIDKEFSKYQVKTPFML